MQINHWIFDFWNLSVIHKRDYTQKLLQAINQVKWHFWFGFSWKTMDLKMNAIQQPNNIMLSWITHMQLVWNAYSMHCHTEYEWNSCTPKRFTFTTKTVTRTCIMRSCIYMLCKFVLGYVISWILYAVHINNKWNGDRSWTLKCCIQYNTHTCTRFTLLDKCFWNAMFRAILVSYLMSIWQQTMR